MTALYILLILSGAACLLVCCVGFVLWLGSLCDERNQYDEGWEEHCHDRPESRAD